MKSVWMLVAVIAAMAGAYDAEAGRYTKGGVEGAVRLRYFSAEIQPGPGSGPVRIGVKLPLGAKIAKTEVFVDREDKGKRKDWSKCDINRKTCAIGDVRILRFHRDTEENWQALSVDLESTADTVRYAKLKVLYQTSSGTDRTGCKRTSVRCGFSGPAQ